MILVKNPELLAAFRRGERAAMEVVYRHYVKAVSHFLQKGFSFRGGENNFYYFKGFHSAFDLHNAVQEVFRRAFEERARLAYNGINSYANWVFAIARNMVINQFRNREIPFSQFASQEDGQQRNFENEITEEYSGVLYSSAHDKQDVALERAELSQIINRFIADQNPEDKQLIDARFVDGLGQEEAAKRIGSTRMKVRTQEAKIRRRLIAYLRETGFLEQYLKRSESADEPTVTQHISGKTDEES